MELTEEQAQKVLEISKDFFRYADNNLYIKDKDASIVKFKPNKAQLAIINRVLELLKEGKPIRIIILKARQMGLSTAIEALVYWWVTNHRNITAMIVSHDDASSKNLYNMFKRYYENCNPIFQPTRKYNTRGDLVFDVDDKVKAIAKARGLEPPGLGSTIKTGTAQNTSVGRSDTLQIVHGSEIGEWDNGEELVASLLQTVPRRPNTMIFLESTAKGRGNYFHKEWEAAKKGDSVFEPFFFPWWQHDEYEIDEEITEYDEEEKEIIEQFKLANIPEESWSKKIAYRRYKKKEFSSDPMKIYQEYPSTDFEAFLASGRARFDISGLLKMEREAHGKEFKYYTLEEAKGRIITAKEEKESPLKIWELPDSRDEYVIGADVAEGLTVTSTHKSGDYSVAEVIRKKDLKTVARWRGHVDPDKFGEIIDKLGRFYNNALVGVEVNNHGLTTLVRLRDLFYTNLYRRERGIDERFEKATERLGWKTDMRTKPLMIDALGEAIREGVLIDYDQTFISEAMTYVVDDNGRTNADSGCYDDCVIAKAIALQMFEWSNTNKADLKAFKPQKMVTRKKSNKVVK